MRRVLVALALALSAPLAASELDLAYDGMLAAQAALQKAQAVREAGVEPLPGERLATVGGQRRLGDEYWQRQKRLEADVERARERFDEAVRRWNEVR
jgi:hypothetical protein